MINVGKSSRGHTQGLSKICRAPIYKAHREVIFAVAQLSCFLLTLVFSFISHRTVDHLELGFLYRFGSYRTIGNGVSNPLVR